MNHRTTTENESGNKRGEETEDGVDSVRDRPDVQPSDNTSSQTEDGSQAQAETDGQAETDENTDENLVDQSDGRSEPILQLRERLFLRYGILSAGAIALLIAATAIYSPFITFTLSAVLGLLAAIYAGENLGVRDYKLDPKEAPPNPYPPIPQRRSTYARFSFALALTIWNVLIIIAIPVFILTA